MLNARRIIERAERNFQSLSARELEIYYTHCHACFGEFDSTGNCPKYCYPKPLTPEPTKD